MDTFESWSPNYLHTITDVKNFFVRHKENTIMLAFISKRSNFCNEFIYDYYTKRKYIISAVVGVIDLDNAKTLYDMFKIKNVPTFIFYEIRDKEIITIKTVEGYNPKQLIQ